MASLKLNKRKKVVKKAEVKKIPEKKVSKTSSAKKTFKPGKYVASKSGSVYHAPKCDWAKKIAPKNKVWLNSPEEAKKKGYKKYSCL